MARKPSATIVDLSIERGKRKLRDYETRIRAILEQNRGALSRLFSSGSIFTRRGTRAGRDLLLAHQHLLKLEKLLGKIEELSTDAAPTREIEQLYRELEVLLNKSSQLTAKSQPPSAKEGHE